MSLSKCGKSGPEPLPTWMDFCTHAHAGSMQQSREVSAVALCLTMPVREFTRGVFDCAQWERVGNPAYPCILSSSSSSHHSPTHHTHWSRITSALLLDPALPQAPHTPPDPALHVCMLWNNETREKRNFHLISLQTLFLCTIVVSDFFFILGINDFGYKMLCRGRM